MVWLALLIQTAELFLMSKVKNGNAPELKGIRLLVFFIFYYSQQTPPTTNTVTVPRPKILSRAPNVDYSTAEIVPHEFIVRCF